MGYINLRIYGSHLSINNVNPGTQTHLGVVVVSVTHTVMEQINFTL